MKNKICLRAIARKLIIKASVSFAASAADGAHGAGGAKTVFFFVMLKEFFQPLAGKNVDNIGGVYVETFKFVKAIEIAGIAGSVRLNNELGVAPAACAALLCGSFCEQREQIVKISDIEVIAV